MTNWEKERLTVPQVTYAATDAWIGRELYTVVSRLQQEQKLPPCPEIDFHQQARKNPKQKKKGKQPPKRKQPPKQQQKGQQKNVSGKEKGKQSSLSSPPALPKRMQSKEANASITRIDVREEQNDCHGNETKQGRTRTQFRARGLLPQEAKELESIIILMTILIEIL